MSKKKEIIKFDLLSWNGDNLHIDSDIGKLDGYQKTWNFIVTERESGKSTLMWKKIYNTFKYDHKPSIVLRRYQTDITDLYIEDFTKIINKFTNNNIKFEYTKSQLKEGGQMDIKLNGEVFCRLIALNTPLSRLKSMFIKNVAYMMFDEFICNKRIGERYLDDEPLRVKEIYTTYNREAEKPIRVYMFGNPYSLYNPFFSSKSVPTNKLFPGALIADRDYCIYCYQIKQELKEKILMHNPLYEFDDAYKKYAFDGRAVQDAEIRVEAAAPPHFTLVYVFKIHGKCLGVFRGCRIDKEDNSNTLFYWIKLMNESEISKRRDIVCFDFGDMANRTVLLNNLGKKKYSYLQQAIEYRKVAYASIEESWLMEEIYQEL